MWNKYESCLYRIPKDYTAKEENKLALFDLDSTLILSSKGEKYAKLTDDYVFAFPDVIEKLRDLYNKEYIIGIFTNRRGSPQMVRDSQKRIDNIIGQIGVSIWAFMATKQDDYRKPNTKMYELFLSVSNIKKVNIQSSFYSGDAIGIESKYAFNRWSNDDSEFAKNIGLKFIEPQDFFDKWTLYIESNTKYIITCGAEESGWKFYRKYINTYTPMEDGRRLLVIEDEKDIKEEEKVVIMILGRHPSFNERLRLGKRLEDYMVYLFMRQMSNELYDGTFPEQFQGMQENERYLRCN